MYPSGEKISQSTSEKVPITVEPEHEGGVVQEPSGSPLSDSRRAYPNTNPFCCGARHMKQTDHVVAPRNRPTATGNGSPLGTTTGLVEERSNADIRCCMRWAITRKSFELKEESESH